MKGRVGPSVRRRGPAHFLIRLLTGHIYPLATHRYSATNKMAMKMSLGTGLLLLLAAAAAVSAGGRTLVLVDNWAIRETHSIFFKSLRGEWRLYLACKLGGGGELLDGSDTLQVGCLCPTEVALRPIHTITSFISCRLCISYLCG